ncbi:hypothetical protein M9H77_27974 [Catharanthus roseus]|uniref:Uncharacterized protein n=1 Tax=Catharanthus roseus TaxID=4058 RepID=A0ACC0AF17_CATRO|nr:hypothetical protein M9H77_27974 [Catharanthus roseus]
MSSVPSSSSDEDACDIGWCGVDEPVVLGGGGCPKPGKPVFGLSNGSTVGCPLLDPSPLSTCTWPGSTCSCLSGAGGTGRCPPPAPRPGCLRASLLTPRAPLFVRAPGDGDATAAQGTSTVYRAAKECIPKYCRWRPYTSG